MFLLLAATSARSLDDARVTVVWCYYSSTKSSTYVADDLEGTRFTPFSRQPAGRQRIIDCRRTATRSIQT
eukprot:scaffold6130_cov131-Cylindrotheca_fusiformis.AAC.10